MLFVVLALCFALPAAVLAWSYPRRVAALCQVNVVSLRAVAAEQRLTRLGEQTTDDWTAQLVAELSAPVDDRLRLAALNALLADADHELRRRDSWPRTAVWICFSGGLLSAIAGYLAGQRMDLLWILPVALGCAATSFSAARRGRRLARQQRERIDALIALVASDLERADLPERRKRR